MVRVSADIFCHLPDLDDRAAFFFGISQEGHFEKQPLKQSQLKTRRYYPAVVAPKVSYFRKRMNP